MTATTKASIVNDITLSRKRLLITFMVRTGEEAPNEVQIGESNKKQGDNTYSGLGIKISRNTESLGLEFC